MFLGMSRVRGVIWSLVMLGLTALKVEYKTKFRDSSDDQKRFLSSSLTYPADVLVEATPRHFVVPETQDRVLLG